MKFIQELPKAIFERFPVVKQLAIKLYRLAPARLRMGQDFWRWLAFLELSEKWTWEEIQEYQMECLRSLLNRLKQTSPYFSRILTDIKIHEIRDMADYRACVPTMDRNLIREHFNIILSTDWKRLRISRCSTSGTTGSPLQFYHLTSDSAREWASICHQWRRVGFDPAKSLRA